uniref:SCP domain-containing protein n=1 Tax=Mesocestoides corti TaxID=53468 RepID=A0A5K3FM18_MESCO
MQKVVYVLAVIELALAQFPSESERDEITERLASIREAVQPPASNMHLLRYSEEMEKVAMKWVSRCIYRYPYSDTYPEFNGTGLSIDLSAKKPKFTDAFYYAYTG